MAEITLRLTTEEIELLLEQLHPLAPTLGVPLINKISGQKQEFMMNAEREAAHSIVAAYAVELDLLQRQQENADKLVATAAT
jgi:hypothetical protein